jgi:hypothetical protein
VTEHHWEAVARHVRQRMAEQHWTTAALAKRSRLSETTIRTVRKGNGDCKVTTLMALSVGLGWPSWYLEEVLRGNENPLTPDVVTLSGLDRKLDALLRHVRQLEDHLATLPGTPAREGRTASRRE